MDSSLIGTVVIPALSLMISLPTAYYFWKDRRHARYQLEAGHVENILAWHKEVVFCLLRLELLPARRPEQHEDLCVLSALIEQGRFFFPNIIEDEYGAGKPLAYRGYRSIVLKLLVEIYNECKNATPNREQNEQYRKSFTSAVFSLIDPVERIGELSKITNKELSSRQSVRDYINAEWR